MELKAVLNLFKGATWVVVERRDADMPLFQGDAKTALEYFEAVMSGALLIVDRITPCVRNMHSLTENHPALRVTVV